MKGKSIAALFVALVIILAVNPRMINDAYNSILGRIALIGIVIFFSMNNVTLGMLAALAVIAASNQFNPFVEGMENNNKIVVLTKEAQKEKDKGKKGKKEKKETVSGVDKEDIKVAIAPKESKTIPLDHNIMRSGDNVTSYKTSMLTNASTLTEGFCPCAAAAF